MTTDTLFDMASMTKVMVTAPSIMLLAEEGILRLEDKVKRYLSNFTGGGKDGYLSASSLNSLSKVLRRWISIVQNSGPDTRKRSKSSAK